MNKKLGWVIVIIVIVLLGWFFWSNQQAGAPTDQGAALGTLAQTYQVGFIDHLDLELPEQDVFIQERAGSNQVVRFEAATLSDASVLGKALYGSAKPTEHDPFKLGEAPLGPFPKGEALDLTVGEWLSAAGRGTYTTDGNVGALALSFENLIPEGLYTLWCSRITFPPNVAVVDRPCGAADGSQNSFTAGTDGRATLNLTIPALEASSAETVSAAALAYHSDGKTYGAEPGPFGQGTHVQIFWILPAPEASQ